MRSRIILPLACLLAALPWVAHADPVQWHAEAGSARAMGGWQGYEYGSGGSGAAAVELPLGRVLGPQLEVGGLWLPHVNPPQDPTVVANGDATAMVGMAGLRLHPFGDFAGPWLDVNGGYLRTGNDDCLGLDAHVGWDWRADEGRLDVGPYLGFLQAFGPTGVMRPDDAHVLSVGLHVALGRERPRGSILLGKASPPPRPPPAAPAPPSDRDGDGIPDPTDACPDVVGIATDDPRTNGCPRMEVRLVEDHLEFDDVILFATDSPQVDIASWPVLERLARFIADRPEIGHVDISGHADERGTDQYNLQLSRARARSVKALLVQFGVDATRLGASAYGESRPRRPGHTEDDWRENRRVEFVVSRGAHAQQGTPSLGAEEHQK